MVPTILLISMFILGVLTGYKVTMHFVPRSFDKHLAEVAKYLLDGVAVDLNYQVSMGEIDIDQANTIYDSVSKTIRKDMKISLGSDYENIESCLENIQNKIREQQ